MLKVYGGSTAGSTGRQFVAAKNKTAARKAFGISAREFRNYYCETRNSIEVSIAAIEPGTVFAHFYDGRIARRD